MDIIITMASAVALTTGLTEVAKRTLGLNKRFVPLIAILLGILTTILILPTDKEYSTIVLYGIAVGLSSCGLFSGIKNTIGK